MPKLFDRVKVNTATTGTGTITFGAASSAAFNTPAEVGALDGDTVRYVIVDGTDYEEGVGTIQSSAAQMARTTVTRSKIGGSYGATKINLSGTAVLAFTASSADILNPANNLSDLASASASRASLGLGTAAVRSDADFVRTDAAQSLTSTQQSQARANAGVLGRNRIINGQFSINRRAAAGGVVDNAYSADRWRIIGEFSSANIFADNFDAAGGSVPAGTLQLPGTTDKGGFFQVIEGRNCKDLRGKTVTLSLLALVSNARLGNMKVGILEWTGTEDATTGDPVSSWGADGVTPTLATNWTFKNTPANLAVTTASAQYSVTATLGSSFNNLAVMIWNDDKSYTANDNFSVTNIQLEAGGVATPFDQRMFQTEWNLCEPYWQRLGGVTAQDFFIDGYAAAGSVISHMIRIPRMRRTPDVTQLGTWTTANTAGPVFIPTPEMLTTYIGATTTGQLFFFSNATTAYIALNAEI